MVERVSMYALSAIAKISLKLPTESWLQNYVLSVQYR
jgi:hypothetical protein